MPKVNAFETLFLEVAKEETVEATAKKNWKLADSALTVQIAAKTGDSVELEDAVEAAKENLQAARVGFGTAITDRTNYINDLIGAKNDLTNAEDALKAHKELLAFLKSEHKTLAAIAK